MKSQHRKSDVSDNQYSFAIVPALLVIAVGLTVRFLFLGADPPLFFKGTTQALLTDPYNLTYFARNKVLFGDWDLFDYHRWDVFKYSLSSAASFVMFKLGGVSRVTANLSAVALNLGGLLLYVFGMARQSRRAALICAVLLFSNMTLIVYGRYPFLENGLIFISGLVFYVFTRWYPHRVVIPIIGLLAALAVLSGKAFGVVLVLPPALIIWYESRAQRKMEIAFLGLIAILSGALLALLYYGDNIMTVYRYLSEQSTGMYGFPGALKSPLTFFEQLISFGGQSKLFCYSPFLLGLLLVSGVYLLVTKRENADDNHRDRHFYFNLTWLVAGFFLLMAFNHRPLRYQLFLLLPLSGVIATAWTESTAGHRRLAGGKLRVGALFLLCWYVMAQVFFIAYNGEVDSHTQNMLILYSLGIGVAVTFLLYRFRDQVLRIVPAFHAAPLVVLLVAMITFQGIWIYKWFDRTSYTLQTAGEDLHQILGPNAVIIGPYAQALTIDNDIKSFIYMFGLKNKEPDLFDRFPITHLAVDLSNYDHAERDYPFLAKARRIGRYWFRDNTVRILQRIDMDRGYGGQQYMPSDYEYARSYFLSPQHDSTLPYLKHFMRRYPKNFSGLTLMSDYYLSINSIDTGLYAMDLMHAFYPEHFSFYFDHAFKLYKLYYILDRPEYAVKADSLFERAVRLNPYVLEDVAKAKREADSVATRKP